MVKIIDRTAFMIFFFRKHDDITRIATILDPEKESLNCYTAASCDNTTDYVMVQPLSMLVSIRYRIVLLTGR